MFCVVFLYYVNENKKVIIIIYLIWSNILLKINVIFKNEK